MGDYPGSENSEDLQRQPATTYGPLPTHGRIKVATVLHTTETTGVPSFNDGDTAPHYSYEPFNDHRWIRWADPRDGYVGTMKGHSTGHYNCKAIQLEIIGYSSKTVAENRDVGHMWIGNLDDQAYAELAAFYLWSVQNHGVEYDVYDRPNEAESWLSGVSSPLRMSELEWEKFSGLTAHGAVPGNSHWDTGVLDLTRIYHEAEPPNYRGVYNVPNQDWARDVIDLNLELGLIVVGDTYRDDWQNIDPRDGRTWTQNYRLVEALDERYERKQA